MADCGMNLEASRQMVRMAANMVTEKKPNYSTYVAMAKKFATESCMDIVNECLQMHGGYGGLLSFVMAGGGAAALGVGCASDAFGSQPP